MKAEFKLPDRSWLPAKDRYHDTVVRCLIRAGWSIMREQYAVVVAEDKDSFRRLFIDSAVLRSHRLSGSL